MNVERYGGHTDGAVPSLVTGACVSESPSRTVAGSVARRQELTLFNFHQKTSDVLQDKYCGAVAAGYG